MSAPVPFLALAEEFVNCFTNPGMKHFLHFVLAHAALWGAPHCVSETMRLTRVHEMIHWTTLYAWMNRGRMSCRRISRTLFDVIFRRISCGGEIIVAIDDTLVKRWGRKFFGLGRYVDPTDKNPGAGRRKVWGHCWVVLAMLYEKARGQWFCFPLAALLFVPQWACAKGWRFQTKIELAVWLLARLDLPGRLIVVVDNLYAKAQLADQILSRKVAGVLVSRLRSNAARFKIEDAFDELKTHGGFADCRQRSHRALKRHATQCLVSYSLLRLLSLTLRGAEGLASEPWWHPPGPPSVTRVRRALAGTFGISSSLAAIRKPNEIRPLRKAA